MGRFDDQITVRDGAGTGRCESFSDDAEGELFVVTLYALDDIEARQVQAALDGGERTPVRAPDIRFDPEVADGAVWGVGRTPSQHLVQGPHARVFWGDTLVEVYLTQTDSWRAGADDLLAMTFQTAQSYGLKRPDPAG